MRSPVTPETALKVIRTWAAVERDHPEVDVLVPEHVLKLCDEALGIVPEQGGGMMAYVVHMLNRAVAVDWLGREVEVPLSYADGMIGAMPVFETREQAEAIAAGRYEVSEVALTTPTDAANRPTPQEVPDGGR